MFTQLRFELVPRITADFGAIDSVHKTPHTGVDVGIPVGTPLYAPEGGIVSRVVDYGDASLGKGVFVRTRDGHQYILGHLSEVKVHEGERVHAGDLLALSGNTGNSKGPHIHFGLLNKAGAFVDPSAAPVADNGHLGILGKVLEKSWNNAHDSVREHTRSVAYDTVVGLFEGFGDLLVDLSYSIALIGGGLAIILHVAGWDKGARWAGMLTVGYVLIKYLAVG